MSRPIIVAITGGSGVSYGLRLVECLLNADKKVHLTISPAARQIIRHELGIDIDLEKIQLEMLWSSSDVDLNELQYFHYMDYMTPMASGSFLSGGMVICPCSGATLSAVAHGASRNLVERAAEVHLKERRRLILVQRETPLSLPTIENMRNATLAGAIILPAMPAWYHGAKTVDHLIDFIVARILDQLQVPHTLIRRWDEQV